MSRIASRSGWRTRRDRGGVSTIVAVLLAGGVLIGMTALVVDVGRFYLEREELQSGADAAAYEIAMDCVKNRPGCALTTVDDTADAYADKNAKDGHADVLGLCGWAPDGDGKNRLPECPLPAAGNLTDCMSTVPAGVKYVEVRTRTEISDGSTALPPSFAGALVPGYEGTTVAACARVGWGPPAGGMAFTFSLCEWNKYVPKDADGNPILAPLGTTDPSFEHAIVFHGPKADRTPTCASSSPGGDPVPGGFGWTDEEGGPCLVTIDTDGSYGGDPGDNVSKGCKKAIEAAVASGEPQLVPVYKDLEPDDPAGRGENTVYTIAGVAAFVITGYHLPGLTPDDPPMNPANLCTGEDHCIYGYFTEALLPASAIGTGSGMGATVIKTIG